MAESLHVVDGRTTLNARGTVALLAVAAVMWSAAGCGSSKTRSTQASQSSHSDLSSTRSLPESGIDRTSVTKLHELWRLRLGSASGDRGGLAGTPVVSRGIAFIQDRRGDVVAVELATGAERWRQPGGSGEHGANGLALSGPRVFGTTDTSAFAVSATSGRLLWERPLVTRTERRVAAAPRATAGLVFVSTVGDSPGGRGTLYALAAASGRVRWQFVTVKLPWPQPPQAGGGGAHFPPSVGGGDVYWGTPSPRPAGGSSRSPNGGSYPGPVLYTDSLLVLAARSGALRWYDQVTPHDVRGYDFQAPPVLGSAGSAPAVFGAGRAGRVLAWSRTTHRRLWDVKIGVPRNDTGRLPATPVAVCPGLFGGVASPLAYASGSLFVPVVEHCSQGSATGYAASGRGGALPLRGRGELVALEAADGARRWTRRFGSADVGCATVARGVVFTSTLDGTIYGLDSRTGQTLWRLRAGDRADSCPALAGDELLVTVATRVSGARVLDLVAFGPKH
jgi:outer membrane protein assembly factor BamB